MARRRTARNAKPRRARASAFAISRAGGAVQIVPRALTGPGLLGRYVSGLLAAVAAVVIGGWVWWVWFALRRPGDPDTTPPWGVVMCLGAPFLLLTAALLTAAA